MRFVCCNTQCRATIGGAVLQPADRSNRARLTPIPLRLFTSIYRARSLIRLSGCPVLVDLKVAGDTTSGERLQLPSIRRSQSHSHGWRKSSEVLSPDTSVYTVIRSPHRHANRSPFCGMSRPGFRALACHASEHTSAVKRFATFKVPSRKAAFLTSCG